MCPPAVVNHRYGGEVSVVEEYEVDLRDYIRVLWRWKWLVLGVLAVAVALSAAFTLTTPDAHRGEAVVDIQAPAGTPAAHTGATEDRETVVTTVRTRAETLPVYTLPTLDKLLLLATSPTVLAGTVEGTSVSAGWLSAHLEVAAQDDMLHLTLEGEISPGEIEALLLGTAEALEQDLQVGLREAVEERLQMIPEERQLALQERELLEAQLAEARSRAEHQRDTLQDEIDRLREDPELLSLELGDRLTLEGHLRMNELDLLYTRLERAQLALDEMERRGLAYLPGAEEGAARIEHELAALEAEIEALEELRAAPPDMITLLRSPEGAVETLRPNLRMNVAVAGVLGLFVGVLLSFFVEAMTKDRRDQEPPGPNTPTE
ncbi:MAG: Wzz/FepE/Etk N-terminal domain-containing protein [Candidatus Bipolaricaulota bacterium]